MARASRREGRCLTEAGEVQRLFLFDVTSYNGGLSSETLKLTEEVTGLANRLEIFISQLDSLVVFLAAGHEEVFEIIRREKSAWFTPDQDSQLPDRFDTYQASINNAAFLLGYAHFEAFLSDLIRDVYRRRPEMLSSSQRHLQYEEVLRAGTWEEIIEMMIDKEVRSLFYGKIEDLHRRFEERLHIRWPDLDKIVLASRIRNCLMHNGGIVDERLSEVSDQRVGEKIRLETSTVHEFGIMGRTVARLIWEEAEKKHFSS